MMGKSKLPAILRDATPREPVEGETFSSNPAHPYWRVRVRFTTGLKPSMERIRAATAAQALDFVCARYPFASRAGSEVLGRWDAATTPLDRNEVADGPVSAAVAPCPAPAAHQAPPPTPPQYRAPTPPLPMTKPAAPVLGADLKRLPRDNQGRAMIDPSIFPAVLAANQGGMSWPVIAEALDCAEGNLRRRVAAWKAKLAAAPCGDGGPLPPDAVVAEKDGFEEFATALLGLGAFKPPNRDFSWNGDLWDVLLHQSEAARLAGEAPLLMAHGQPVELATRLTRQLRGSGHIISCVPSTPVNKAAEPPTAPPAAEPTTTTTKAGGFMVQVIVNPVGLQS
jgi:hypothetical protein